MIGLAAKESVSGWGIGLGANFSTYPNQYGKFNSCFYGSGSTDDERNRNRMIWQAIRDAATKEREVSEYKRAGRFSYRHSQARKAFCKIVAASAELLLADPDWQAQYAQRQGAI